MGACVIEKHFTLDRSDKGPDSDFSIEPLELERLSNDVKDAWKALGSMGFDRQEAEESNRIFRRSIYVTQDIGEGEKLNEKNIRRIRPGFGCHPKHYEMLMGKKAIRKLLAGTPLNLKDVNI